MAGFTSELHVVELVENIVTSGLKVKSGILASTNNTIGSTQKHLSRQ